MYLKSKNINRMTTFELSGLFIMFRDVKVISVTQLTATDQYSKKWKFKESETKDSFVQMLLMTCKISLHYLSSINKRNRKTTTLQTTLDKMLVKSSLNI